MNKIKFNHSNEFTILSYIKSTWINDEGKVTSTGNCTITADTIGDILNFASEKITSIEIYSDEQLIYTLSNINARIESVNESLVTDHMTIGFNLIFSQPANA